MRETIVIRATGSQVELRADYAGGQISRGGRIGLFGNLDMMDTPFNATNYTAQFIQDQQANSVADVVQSDPAVRVARSMASLGADYRGQHARLSVDVGWQDHDIDAPRPSVTPLGDIPRPPDAGSNFAPVQASGTYRERQSCPGSSISMTMSPTVQGGMPPMEALRAGTIGSAEAIGRAAELGSIEPGKCADLVILSLDPRTDIRRSRAITEVMKSGRLYEAETLDEVWPRRRPFPEQWFAHERPSSR